MNYEICVIPLVHVIFCHSTIEVLVFRAYVFFEIFLSVELSCEGTFLEAIIIAGMD